jgi:CheY-like chemotaxis protein
VRERLSFGVEFTNGCADNPVAQKLLVKQLQRYDLNVIATSNGEEAIAGN